MAAPANKESSNQSTATVFALLAPHLTPMFHLQCAQLPRTESGRGRVLRTSHPQYREMGFIGRGVLKEEYLMSQK
jgi:hypothetical protein